MGIRIESLLYPIHGKSHGGLVQGMPEDGAPPLGLSLLVFHSCFSASYCFVLSEFRSTTSEELGKKDYSNNSRLDFKLLYPTANSLSADLAGKFWRRIRTSLFWTMGPSQITEVGFVTMETGEH